MRRKDLAARALYTSAAMNLYGEKIILKVASIFWKKLVNYSIAISKMYLVLILYSEIQTLKNLSL